MNQNHKTYTYTARNADDPDKVVTFTLDEERLRVNLTDLVDETPSVITSESKPKELMHLIKSKVKPVSMKFKERVFGPVHISDVDAKLKEDKFLVRMWPRLAGLRLAPVKIDMGQVDNEDAAEAFVGELEQRKETGPAAKKFVGPLDYWFGWAGLMLLTGLFIRMYRQKAAGGEVSVA
jgi:hypothetical protein